MPTFHFIFRRSCRNLLIVRPSCHFENILANDDQEFAVSTSPEAVEGAPRPVLASLEELFKLAAVDMGAARSVSETMIYF